MWSILEACVGIPETKLRESRKGNVYEDMKENIIPQLKRLADF